MFPVPMHNTCYTSQMTQILPNKGMTLEQIQEQRLLNILRILQ
jgi:hypothetical protein